MYGDGPLNGFCVRGRSVKDIRQVADAVRKFFEVGDLSIDVEALLERLPDFGVSCSVVEDDYLPPGVEACFDPDSLTIYLTEDTYQGMRTGIPRARFTAMHELGHLFLAHKRMLNRLASVPRVFEDSEWQANQFAAEGLMPLASIRKLQLSAPWQLMEAFGVSHDAACRRLDQLRKRNEL